METFYGVMATINVLLLTVFLSLAIQTVLRARNRASQLSELFTSSLSDRPDLDR